MYLCTLLMPPLLYFQRFRDPTNEECSNKDDEVDERDLNANDGERVTIKTYGSLSPHNLLLVFFLFILLFQVFKLFFYTSNLCSVCPPVYAQYCSWFLGYSYWEYASGLLSEMEQLAKKSVGYIFNFLAILSHMDKRSLWNTIVESKSTLTV